MHAARVGFAIKTGLVGKLSCLLKGIDLLLTLKLLLSGNQHNNHHRRICDYDEKPDEVKAKFSDDLDSLISATPKLQAQHHSR